MQKRGFDMTEDERDTGWADDWRVSFPIRELLGILHTYERYKYTMRTTVWPNNVKYYLPPFVVETRNAKKGTRTH